MRHSEQPTLTPAQLALLEFVSHTEADSMFQQLHTTLSMVLGTDEPGEGLTFKVAQACYFHLELLGLIHAISVEEIDPI